MKISFDLLKKKVNARGFGPSAHLALLNLYEESSLLVAGSSKISLTSKVDGKTYFAFSTGPKVLSRAINELLFDPSTELVMDILKYLLQGKRQGWTAAQITKAFYTVAITCCAARDLTSTSDRKTQGTFFEYLCAMIIQGTLGVIPTRSLPVLNLDLKGSLPTDFIFDLGPEKPKFHLPVKTSTRERIIQVWAHQRVLDGVYGVGRFLAIPFILTETKLDVAKQEVTEICLPWQWRLYQMHIASLWNVCYLDMPNGYRALDTVFPRVAISTVGEFLEKDGRLDQLLDSHQLSRNDQSI